MTTVISDIGIEGLRRTHFEQLLCYLEDVKEKGWYYGNKKQFDARHEDLKFWIIEIIDLLNQEGVIIPKK
jgi:hypothetical protein